MYIYKSCHSTRLSFCASVAAGPEILCQHWSKRFIRLLILQLNICLGAFDRLCCIASVAASEYFLQ